MTMMHCAPLHNTLSWTRPPAVVRQCMFMCFGVVALEGGAGIFLLDSFKI